MSDTAKTAGRFCSFPAEPKHPEARVFVADADVTPSDTHCPGCIGCGRHAWGPDPEHPGNGMRVWFVCERARQAIGRERAGRPPLVRW